jgi:hypothetical protein
MRLSRTVISGGNPPFSLSFLTAKQNPQKLTRFYL